MNNIPIDALTSEKLLIENKLFELNKRLREINNLLNHYNAYGELWINKTIGALTLFEEPLNTDDLLRHIFYHDSEELNNPVRRRNHVFKLSAILNRLCKNNELYSKKYSGVKGNFYFLPDWVTHDESDIEFPYKVKLEYEVKVSRKIEKTIINKRKFESA